MRIPHDNSIQRKELMSESLRAVVQFVLVLCGISAGSVIFVHSIDPGMDYVTMWKCVAVALAVAAACIGVLIKFRKPEQSQSSTPITADELYIDPVPNRRSTVDNNRWICRKCGDLL